MGVSWTGSDVGCELRFTATVANRLETLGALTKADRHATGNVCDGQTIHSFATDRTVAKAAIGTCV